MKIWLREVISHLVVISILLVSVLAGNNTVTVFSEQSAIKERTCIVIDAGHGGTDGGATSCTGMLESELNLQIALRLNDLLHFTGYQTLMIRTDDRSVYTEGETIAAKKVSDLKERVRIANSEDHAVLISLHQNFFADNRYSGAQVFYAASAGSADLAQEMQRSLIANLNPGSTRSCKKGEGIYLMEKIQCTGVLVECGFLSNPQEEAKLRNSIYQQQLCCVIGATLCAFLSNS